MKAHPNFVIKLKSLVCFALPNKWSIIVCSERPSGKNRIAQELVHRLTSEIDLLTPLLHICKHTLVNVLVSTRGGSLLKGISGHTLISPLLLHYSTDFIIDLVFGVFIIDLVLVFGCILLLCLDLLIISVRLFMCYLVCVALLQIFRLDITCIVLLLCRMTDVSLEFLTIYQHFCFAPLVSRLNWKVQYLFCIFCFLLNFCFLKDFRWFTYLDLNLVSLMPQ